MRLFRAAALAALLGLYLPSLGQAQLADKKVLTLAAAKQMVAAAEAEATRNGWSLVFVVVDESANLILLERMDGVQLASLQVAQAKARTAALYRRPSKDFADRLASGSTTALVMPDVMPLDGGLPIIVDGQVIGAMAASGATGAQDAQAVQAGIATLIQPPSR
jgi:uncharacterized protein GlcG (DUF336 family)